MTTRADLMTVLTLRLDDADRSAPRWSDDELHLYLRESVDRYSKLMPRLRDQEFTSDGVSSRYNVPDDLVDRKVLTVTISRSSGGFAQEIDQRNWRPRNSNRYWEVIDDELVFGFVPPAGQIITIRYQALHSLPEDDISNTTVPSEDFDLIYLWAEALAWKRLSGNDAALTRWKESGARNDSPMIPHHVLLERQYEKLCKEKKAGGRALVRVRAQNRNRLSDRAFY